MQARGKNLLWVGAGRILCQMLTRRVSARGRSMTRRRPMKCASLACAIMIVAAACSTDSGSDEHSCKADDSSCTVLWGVAVPDGSARAVKHVESALGAKFNFVYSYHDINDEVPSSDDKEIVAAGHGLHISIIPRDFALADKNTVLWKDVAAGRYDTNLMQQARGVAGLPGRVFVTFDHEPDQAAKVARGTPHDYIAAWRHVHDLYERAGAKNVTWVWVMMGWKPAFSRAGKLWPGNKYVDWISWEVYNHSGCFQGTAGSANEESFRVGVETAYEWFHHSGKEYGINPDKPMMISESGTVLYPGDPQRTAKWYAEVPSVLSKYPQIRAVTLFDNHVDTCDYQFQKQPAALDAVSKAMRTARDQ